MKNMQKGFTLIELMVVVAIVGILTAIALPAYQDYTRRSHVVEGLTLASAAKIGVTEFYVTNGRWPANAALQAHRSIGLAQDISLKGNAVNFVRVLGSTITISYNTKASGGGANNTIIMQGSVTGSANAAGSILWKCKSGTLPTKYRPVSCR